MLARRAFARFGDARYARLAEISVSHLYNLRASAGYRSRVAGNLIVKALAEIAGVSPQFTRVVDHRILAHAAE